MRTRSRLIAAIILTALGALGVFYYATTEVISQAFSTIETQTVKQNTDRAVQAIDNQVEQLQSKVLDWSDWDDTYAFVENHNNNYIVSNLQSSALTQLGIDTMLFYNQSGKLVFNESVDPTSGNPAATSSEVEKSFVLGSPLMATSVSSQSKGILAYPDGIFQFVALPILTSNATGPPHGTLVFGMWLTGAETSSLSTQTALNLNYYSLASPHLPSNLKTLLGPHPKSSLSLIDNVSSNQAIGYEVVSDAYGKPGCRSR